MKTIARVGAKTLLIFLLLLGLYQIIQPLDFLGKLSLYNVIFPGRERLPFGESPKTAYNFTLNNLDAMTASHRINAAGEKETDRLRVLIIGDSSSWGTLLRPEETLAGKLNGRQIAGTQKTLEVYNFAYPTLSLSKDLLLLERGIRYKPDLILWPMTLESFPVDKQTSTPLVANNAAAFARLSERCLLDKSRLPSTGVSFFDRSLFAQRREMADLIRLQLLGFMWGASGIDQDYPKEYAAPQIDLEPDNTFHGYEGALPDEALAWDTLHGAAILTDGTPVLIINEPILISDGENSNIRYNFYYPKEAYDAWRQELPKVAADEGFAFLDLWDELPISAFTNSAIHYDAESAAKLADIIIQKIEEMIK